MIAGAAAIGLAGCTSSAPKQVATPAKLLLPPGPALPSPSKYQVVRCNGVSSLQRTFQAAHGPTLNAIPSCINEGGHVVMQIRLPECFGFSRPKSSDPSVLEVRKVSTDGRATVRLEADARSRGIGVLGGEVMPTCDPEGPPEWAIAWVIRVDAG